jgi:hypothetical protein
VLEILFDDMQAARMEHSRAIGEKGQELALDRFLNAARLFEDVIGPLGKPLDGKLLEKIN